jgi:hypothetical protein
MITSIVETIQKNLGYPSLEKVDPNNQEVKDISERSQAEKLAQAAITAVLTGFGKFTSSDRGASYIVSNDKEQDWLDIIFDGRQADAVARVAQYANTPAGEAEDHMQRIAREAVKLIRQSAGDKYNAEKIKNYMKGQRHNILLYLPAAMQLGDLLKNDSLDDRTNKMEGPVSNMMHNIENKLSGGGS